MKVIHGDNIEVLKQYPDNYFDAIVTDPPYGLGKEPNAEELMKDWIEKGYHEIQGKGFMGKEWDAFVPQPQFWKEVYRVLKHGGHVLSFFGTRTYDWGVMAMRFAGFEVRDCLQWLYGSGFPKSHNISIAIDKMYGAERKIVGEKITGNAKKNTSKTGEFADGLHGGQQLVSVTEAATEQAKQWDGWGSALKPANEPIVLARKPLEKGLSIAENVLKWETGGINIDECRIGTNDKTQRENKGVEWGFRKDEYYENREKEVFGSTQGRFPANVILSHHPECVLKGLKKVKGQIDKPTNRVQTGNTWDENNSGLRKNLPQNSGGFADENGEETVEHWECHEDCPIKILDEQSGVTKSSDTKRNRKTIGSFGMPNDSTPEYNDIGGASRFFYTAKASKSERNKGLNQLEQKSIKGRDERQDIRNVAYKLRPTPTANVHPTVKPVSLMQYLVRLITPPNGIVLDPFLGSGTTGVACKLEGFDFVGIEQDAEYCKIAQARIDNYEEEPEEDLPFIDAEGNTWEQGKLF